MTDLNFISINLKIYSREYICQENIMTTGFNLIHPKKQFDDIFSDDYKNVATEVDVSCSFNESYPINDAFNILYTVQKKSINL